MRINAQGSRERDKQRSRLYEAEDMARRASGQSHLPCMTMAQTQAALDTVLGSRWFRQRFRVSPGSITLKDGRGTRNASYSHGSDEINMPRWAREKGLWVLLHEVTHMVIPSRFAWHGPEFAKVYLALVERFIGADEALLLRTAYKQKGVTYRTTRVSLKPQYRVATQQEKREYLKREQAKVLNTSDKARAAKVLREAAKAGIFGPSGHKERTYALAIARKLEV